MYTGAPQTLHDFCDFPEFNPSDKDRFYRVHSLDGSTIVALSHVTLVSITGESKEERFKSTTKDGVHAEKRVIEDLNDKLSQEDTSQLKEVRLVTMATASPCSECRAAMSEMLENWRTKKGLEVNYTLRVANFYYGEERSKLNIAQQLITWKKKLEEIGVKFQLQPISVCEELRDHTTRQERDKSCLMKRREADEEILREIRNINAVDSTVREYYPPQAPRSTN